MKAQNQGHPDQAGRRTFPIVGLGSTFRALLFGALLCAVVTPLLAQQPSPPPVPKPTVPELFTLQGEFVRMAYNNEGFVTLGYRTANYSIAQEWMLLEVGMTLRSGVKNCVLRRDALTLKTPDGKTVALATAKEYGSVDLRGVQLMADAARDNISYFPSNAVRRCRIGFFGDLDAGTLGYDQVELSDQSACLGRLYFHVPGGIKVGQHWLNVRFADSVVQVPFRILTKEEEKEFRKNWEGMKKEHDASTGQ